MKKIIFKNLLGLALILLFNPTGFSQVQISGLTKYRKGNEEPKKITKNFTGGKKIFIEVEGAGLVIEGHNGNDVVIETEDFEDPPERAKGLRALYNTAEDNTGIGLQIDVASGVMTIKKASHEDMEFHLKVPAGVSIEIEEQGWQGDDFHIKGVKGEIEVKGKGSNITIDDVTGPVVANTTSGDITVVFTSLNQDKPTSISNTSGFIDVTLPSNTKADLVLKSVTGEIYTDLDIKFETNEKQGDMRRIGGHNLKGTINGGGVEVALKTISDDIYLRKK